MTSSYINTFIETTSASVNAFNMTATGDTLYLAATGSLVALGTGSAGLDLAAGNQSATLYGAVYSALGNGIVDTGSGGSNIVIDGTVDSTAPGGIGILETPDSDRIVVNGSVEGGGNSGVNMLGQYSSLTVNGSVQDNVDGVSASGNYDYVDVNGSVQGLKTGVGTGVVFDGQQDMLNVGAKGDVYGFDNGVEVHGAGGTVKNEGHISGQTGLFGDLSDGLAIENDGFISNVVIAISNNVTIENGGTISATFGNPAIDIGDQSTNAFIENSGTVHGSLMVDETSSATVENYGKWNGSMSIDSVSGAVINLGNVTGGIVFDPTTAAMQGDIVSNDGTIHNGVWFTAGSGPAMGDTLVNSGTIFGGVSMGVHETLSNTGTIRGNVEFSTAGGAASADNFDNSNGIVIGKIGGGAGGDTFMVGMGSNTYQPGGVSDTFVFGAQFGNDIIDNFATGSTHDTIQLSENDFTSYTELQTHMAQVGKDTIITLASGSTIELHDLKMTHLVSHDFLFV